MFWELRFSVPRPIIAKSELFAYEIIHESRKYVHALLFSLSLYLSIYVGCRHERNENVMQFITNFFMASVVLSVMSFFNFLLLNLLGVLFVEWSMNQDGWLFMIANVMGADFNECSKLSLIETCDFHKCCTKVNLMESTNFFGTGTNWWFLERLRF